MFAPAFVIVFVPPSGVPEPTLDDPVVVAVVGSGSHVLPGSFRAWTLETKLNFHTIRIPSFQSSQVDFVFLNT